MTYPNTVAHSAGAVCCPDVDSAMCHRDRGSWVTWWNTGRALFDRPYWTHVGQMVAQPDRRRSLRARACMLVALMSMLLVGACTSQPATAAGGGVAAPSPATVPQPVVTLTVGKLGLDRSVLVPLGLNPDRTVVVPPVREPLTVGWYDLGPTPGDRGPAVILGHVNGGGRPGAFVRLDTLTVGDTVVTAVGALTTTYRVTRVQHVLKEQFPTAAVYSDTPDPELRLITCGGDLDATGHNYLDNIIVWAVRA